MKLSASLLAAALGLAALLDPGVAAAATRHHRAAGPSFPMKADEYRALMEKRIDGVRAVIDKKLDRRSVSADRKKAIHKIFDDAGQDLRAEIARAAADGTVTQREADRVKPLLIGLRGKVRERLRAEKDPAAKAKLTKEESAKKEKAKEPLPKKPAPSGGAHDGEHAQPAKTADAGPHQAAGHTKAKHPKAAPGKKVGPTKPAKASPGKKRKRAEVDPGANL